MKSGSAARETKGWFLYDGSCGLCSRGVARSRGVLAHAGLGVLPLQTDWVSARLGLDPLQAPPDVTVLLADGTLIQGAQVYRFVFRSVWWLKPLYLLSVVPGLRAIFDGAYRLIASRRARISTVCGLRPDL